MLSDEDLRKQLADMLAAATDGELDPGELLGTETPLSHLGVTSLAFLRLIDAVEEEFGVEIDVDPASDNLAALAGRIADADR
jgi:acyl carrier protein